MRPQPAGHREGHEQHDLRDDAGDEDPPRSEEIARQEEEPDQPGEPDERGTHDQSGPIHVRRRREDRTYRKGEPLTQDHDDARTTDPEPTDRFRRYFFGEASVAPLTHAASVRQAGSRFEANCRPPE